MAGYNAIFVLNLLNNTICISVQMLLFAKNEKILHLK